MLGLDTSWYIGSPATARPLANEPFAPPKRRRRLVRGCTIGFLPCLTSQPGLIFGCPNAAQRQGRAKRSLYPPSRGARGSLGRRRAAAARARTHKAARKQP